jgi:hypothetical protein
MATKKRHSATEKKGHAATDPYSEFVQRLRLSGMGLESASASVRRIDWTAAIQNQSEIERQMELKDNILAIQDGSFVLAISFDLKQQTKTSEDPLVEISGSYSALFVHEGTPNEEFVRRFASREARIIFWPYIRQHIADVSARMSVQNILLPLSSELAQATE